MAPSSRLSPALDPPPVFQFHIADEAFPPEESDQLTQSLADRLDPIAEFGSDEIDQPPDIRCSVQLQPDV